jgi:hypothetical protein
VFNFYGELSNAQLLHSYGFIEEDNPYDNVLIPEDIVMQHLQQFCEEDGEQLISQKKDSLKSIGILTHPFIISKEDMLPQVTLNEMSRMC